MPKTDGRYGDDRGRYGDDRDRTDDPLLAKQVLSQLSYAPRRKDARRKPRPQTPAANPGRKPKVECAALFHPTLLVGQGGFEPPTPRLSSVCSNQLSY